MMFFCQAEDGIRDLVRSRGLGDVYKRQNLTIYDKLIGDFSPNSPKYVFKGIAEFASTPPEAVSYTHLTLPTSDLV